MKPLRNSKHRKQSNQLRNALLGLGTLSAAVVVSTALLSGAGDSADSQKSFAAPNSKEQVVLGQSEIGRSGCSNPCSVDSTMHFPDDILWPYVPVTEIQKTTPPVLFEREVPSALSYASAYEAPVILIQKIEAPAPVHEAPAQVTPEPTHEPVATEAPTKEPAPAPEPSPVQTTEPAPETTPAPSEAPSESPAPTPTGDSATPSEPAPEPTTSPEPIVQIPDVGLLK